MNVRTSGQELLYVSRHGNPCEIAFGKDMGLLSPDVRYTCAVLMEFETFDSALLIGNILIFLPISLF